MSAFLLSLALLATGAEAPDAVVVCPQEFVAALDPLLAHRHSQGHRMTYVPSTWSPEQIRTAIRQAAQGGKLKFVLLVGDADPRGATDPRVRAVSVPTHRARAKVNVQYGSEPEIATDNWYADLDDDHIPDLAIGRIPADNAAEVSRVVMKILAYEKSLDAGEWRQRVNLIAGVGGFGGLIDGVVEMTTKKFLTGGIPAEYTTSMTYGSWRSPFCPDPRLFHDMAVARHNEGCLFWVYIGHGQQTALDRVVVPGGRYHILNADDCSELHCTQGQPIAVMLACYTAAYDQPQDCLGEELLRAKEGPIAVYGGSRVTMPYAMAVMGTELLDEYFKNQPATLGETILNAKRRMVVPLAEQETTRLTNRHLLDGLALVMSPNAKQLGDERMEHLLLFNLLGDPMLKLRHAEEVKLEVANSAEPGQTVRIAGSTPLAGRAIVELVCRRDCLTFDPPARDSFDPSDAGFEALQRTYLQANDSRWSRQTIDLPAGEFSTQLTIPSEAHGPCHVRVFVQSREGHALGAANVFVRAASAPATATATAAKSTRSE